jgi:UTP--glucose-1-phosphate uridylyltransferase
MPARKQTTPKQKLIRKGVIIVAGRGTRFLPATKALPKEMLPILDKPVLQYIVEEMAESGIESILFVTNSQKRAIEDHFDRDYDFERFLEQKGKSHALQDLIELSNKVQFYYTRQPAPLGNGHALLMAEQFIGDEPFAFSDGDSVIDADIPVTKQLISIFEKTKISTLGVQRIEDKKAMTRFGNVYTKKSKNGSPLVEKIVEKPDEKNVSPEGFIVGGMRYIFTKEIWPLLKSQTLGKDGEIWLADAANQLAKNGELIAHQYDGRYFDTGNKHSMLEAIIHFAKKEGIIGNK